MTPSAARRSANGSFEPVGFSSIAKKLTKRIQLVRQAHRHRHRRGRHFVALPDRLVMVADRVGDGVGLALGAGVVAADQALQFGELADHPGDEVGLGEARGAFGDVGGSAALDDPLLDQPPRQLGHALDLVGDGAELLVEDDLLELLRLLRERDLEVLLPEEARVGQARGEDLSLPSTIAAPPSAASMLAVQTKCGASLPCAVAQHEIFLVGARGELDHFGRDFEERGVEAAEQRHRPFGQPGILDHQPLVLDQREAGVARRPRRAVADDRLALVVVDDDVAGAQLLDIVVGAADGDRARDGGSGGRAWPRRR